jgi:hypothetical protein
MKKVFLVLLVIFVCNCFAQDSIRVTEGFHRNSESSGRKVLATGMVSSFIVFSLVWSYDAWWKDSRSRFFFRSERWFSGEKLGIDKTGHFFTSYFYFHAIRNIMLWGGYSRSNANWWAAGASAFFALAIEIGDGVGDIGFDYQDIIFNLGGVGYAWMQTMVPFLRNFNFKWSYVPKNGYKFPPRFTKQYDAHTYWLAFNFNELLPSSLEPYWPDFLQLAVGYGVDDQVSKREVVIGFDINFEVFPVSNEDILLAQRTLNMFHVPAPAVKFTESKKTRYFFFQTN